MTCLTVTPASAAEAASCRADLIVTHHPLPFRPLARLTADATEGRLLLELIEHRIAIYSPHTAFDSARQGINQRLAEALGLTQVEALVPAADGELGSGRRGKLSKPTTLQQLADRVKAFLRLERLQCVGPLDRRLESVAVACGSGGDFLLPARLAGCDALVTGEARFHACLEAEATGMALLLAGHFATERFAVEDLSAVLAAAFPALEVWASADERDPLAWA
jgi:dinuclear metal center YbgI/SA1388 family protein